MDYYQAIKINLMENFQKKTQIIDYVAKFSGYK